MNGYAIYETPVCKNSTYKGVRKKACEVYRCKHHVKNVPVSQSGTEYQLVKLCMIEHCVVRDGEKGETT